MKKQLPAFLSGVLVTTMVFGLGTAALAASGSVSFNASNLQFNGTQISAKGENYALDNGCQAPSSITYTDEKGGGTTYLPVRRIGELMGVETGWDGVTGSVTVKGTVKVPAVTPTTSPAPDTTISDDYSTWTAEEEAAYLEFRGMWEVEARPASATLTCNSSNSVLSTFLLKYTDEALLSYIRRLDTMIYDNEIEPTPTTVVIMSYVTTNGDGLWDDICDQVPFKYGFNTSRVGSNFSLERVLQKLNT